MAGERCGWCGADGIEEIEIQAGTYKVSRHPITGQTARICTRLPVTAWACANHRDTLKRGKFVAPRQSKAPEPDAAA